MREDIQKTKAEFSDFLLRSGAIKFGTFKLKSGRISPYFVNIGAIGDGLSASKLGEFYAKAIVGYGLLEKTDVLFGPSYKGIPIVVSTAVALFNLFGSSKRFAFNRKEAKEHGEGGLIIGSIKDGDRVGMLDDVMTTGKTKEEVLSVILSSAKVNLSYILIAVDRLERGETDLMATLEFERRYGIPVRSIVTIEEVAERALQEGLIAKNDTDAIRTYLNTYGGKRT
ncbi:MAG: orotate phosphoribosyltransferase [Candidatus Verstraetearchaeota archaeon]|nr:orotate phosphoribosyltransferase [Candidatus Verstraetearchaeota archaeon]